MITGEMSVTAIDPAFVVHLSNRLNETYSRTEADRGLVIPTTVRSFLEAVIAESITLRSSEWLDVKGIDCGSELPKTIEEGVAVVANLLGEVAPEHIGGAAYVTLVGMVEEIHFKWCGVFPFCRSGRW